MILKICVLLSLSSSFAFGKEAKNSSPIVLKWMVAHAPNNYFVEMARYFKKRVESESKKSIRIEIVDDFDNEAKQSKIKNSLYKFNYVLNSKIKQKNQDKILMMK